MKKLKSSILLFLTSLSLFAYENLVPPPEKQKGPDKHWKGVRNAAAQVKFSVDSQVVPAGEKKSLKINMTSPEGYAEWRIEPLMNLEPGAYTFAALVKNRTDKKPYYMIYSFNAQGKARIICGAYGKAGNHDWYLLTRQFNVPADSVKIRVGIGLSSSKGDLWFAKVLILKGKQEIKSPASAVNTQPDNNAPALKKWIADWIWVKDPEQKIPQTIFSKVVDLHEIPAQAFIQVTADNSYELSVNGENLGGNADWKTVNTYNIASLLKKGKNNFSLSVMNFGGPGGVIAQGQIWYKDGKTSIIKTDGTWKHVIPGAKTQAGLEVLGVPPVLPWGKIVFTNLTPPKNILLPIEEYTLTVMPGGIVRMVFELSEKIPEEELSNLKLELKRNGRLSTISGYDPIITKSFDNKKLTVELPVSAYATPGKYQWALNGITLSIKGISNKNDFTILPGEKLPPFTAARFSQQTANVLNTPGGRQAPFTYDTHTPSTQHYFNWQATNGHMYEIYIPTGYWLNEDKWDLSQIEKNFMQILEADPYASVYLKIRVDTPSWWISRHPDECYLSQKGRRGPQSFCSDVWRESVVKGFNSLVEKISKKPFGNHIGGIMLMGFKGGEFQLWGESQGEYDCSPAAQKTFDKWQQKNNINPKIELPSPALESPFKQGAGYVAIRKNFFRFVAERHAGNLIYFAEKFKEKFAKKYDFGVYFGYAMEHAGSKRMLFAGHLGLASLISQGKLDIISCPASYGLRSMNLSHAYMLPVDSALLHNIMPILENDVRNYKTTYAKDSSGESLPDLSTSLNSLNKLNFLAAVHGTAVRYLALQEGVDWFQDFPILTDIRSMNKQIMKLKPAELGQNGQVVLVLNCLEYCGAAEKPYLQLSGDFLGNIRDVLMRTGRSVAFVTMDDWLANRKLWKYAVFPLPGLLTKQQLQVISSEYGKLPALTADDGALIITPGKISKTTKLRALRDTLATPEALKSGYDTIWYVGGNFTAIYDTQKQKLRMK